MTLIFLLFLKIYFMYFWLSLKHNRRLFIFCMTQQFLLQNIFTTIWLPQKLKAFESSTSACQSVHRLRFLKKKLYCTKALKDIFYIFWKIIIKLYIKITIWGVTQNTLPNTLVEDNLLKVENFESYNLSKVLFLLPAFCSQLKKGGKNTCG